MEPYGCVVVGFEADVEEDESAVFFVAFSLFLVGGGGDFVAMDAFVLLQLVWLKIVAVTSTEGVVGTMYIVHLPGFS